MRPLNIFVPHSSELFTDYRPHGDGLIAHSYLTRLAERGHTLHAVCQQIDLKGSVPPNLHLHLLPIQEDNFSARLRYMRQLRPLFQRLRKTVDFDLVHQVNPVYSGISLALLGCNLPLALGIYSARWPADPNSIAGSRIARVVRDSMAALQQLHADALLLSSPASRDLLPLPELLDGKLHYIPYGIDASQFTPRAGYDMVESARAEQDAPSLLFLANPNRRKGIYPLIEALPAVLAKHPRARLKLVGESPELSQVMQLAQQLGVAHAIDPLGWKPREEAIALYRDCTLFLMPSLGEPFGMAALEAMSCGRPLIVTRAGGLGHYVPDQGSIKVPPSDAPALATAINTLLDDPARRTAMSRFNRQYVLDHMDWKHIIDQTEDVYRSLLNLP
ncbi:glycosyltransferase family 4 protein [Terriglobus tenax]|uniref:glycosyltransferase family 4 protein n=1 Tax=Terriglobus tenax TaxID=1111115 RepID=UPI0021E01DD1|nr:glycosyltransferase family 4 protein [Terriglobus tenax]